MLHYIGSSYYYHPSRVFKETPKGYYSIKELCSKFNYTVSKMHYLLKTRKLFQYRIRVREINTFFYPLELVEKEILYD